MKKNVGFLIYKFSISILMRGNMFTPNHAFEMSRCKADAALCKFYVQSHITTIFFYDAMHKFFSCEICHRSVDLALY